MELVIVILFAIMCSAAQGIIDFMAGRCARRLPVGGMLPQVVYSARFGPETSRP
ncbi:MAG: hypothetical protein ABSB76_22095 [Streptosporangiaceae bacterium]|jgi:hypothetical protein